MLFEEKLTMTMEEQVFSRIELLKKSKFMEPK